MEFLTPASRPIIFVTTLVFLWVIEFGFPLVPKKDRRILPNILLMVVTLGIYSLFGLLIVFITNWTASASLGVYHWFKITDWLALVLSILFLDFWAAYVAHVLMHKMSWLWKFHSVHHSDEMVDVTTSLRQHPGESILRNIFLISGIILLGIPVWMVIIYQTICSHRSGNL
uniref:sterol desaturase family protein n=1 Tax=Roseivirga sp. TaxID=1964215 RepID=UPI004048652B